MKNTIVMRVVENTDPDINYGVLVVRTDADITSKDIQDKIYEIKNSFPDDDDASDDDEVTSGNYTWDDIMNRFPDEWDTDFYDDDPIEI